MKMLKAIIIATSSLLIASATENKIPGYGVEIGYITGIIWTLIYGRLYAK